MPDPTPDPKAAEGPAAPAADPLANPGTQSPAPAAAAGNALSLTQAELDAIVLNRTSQARRVATEAADKAKKWDEYQTSIQTEAEKAVAKQKALDERNAAITAQTNARAIATEVRLVATEKGVRKEALSIVAQLLAGHQDITVGDDGTVTGAEAAVTKLLTENKYLLADTKPAAGKAGGEFSGEQAATQAERIRAAEAAKKPTESIHLKVAQALGRG